MVIWQNEQWRVSADGLETVERGYAAYDIPKERLLARRGKFYEWPLHMAEKAGIDLDEFLQAFHMALIWHHRERFADFSVQRSAAEARRIRKEDEEFERRLPPRDGRYRFSTREDLEIAA